MAELTPGGAIYSFAGTTILGISAVAAIGFPSIARAPVEAYAQTLGSALPVDLLNGVAAPRKDTVTLQLLLRASDSLTDPATAWQFVMAGYRTVQGLPESGILMMYEDASGSGLVSCTARRQPIPLTLTPSNARHIILDVTFIPLTNWS